MKSLDLLQLPVKRHTLFTHFLRWVLMNDSIRPESPSPAALRGPRGVRGSAGGHEDNRRKSGGVMVLIDDLALIMTFNWGLSIS